MVDMQPQGEGKESISKQDGRAPVQKPAAADPQPIESSTVELNLATGIKRTEIVSPEESSASRSMAQLEPKRAAHQLDLALERIRIVNGGMTRVVDLFLAKSEKELGEQAAQIRNKFWQSLHGNGIETDGIALRVGRSENIEGSLYIKDLQSGNEVRYRWQGTGFGQDIYLNGSATYVNASRKGYAQAMRFEHQSLRAVFNEDESHPLTGNKTARNEEALQHYEAQVERYNNRSTGIFSFFNRRGTGEPPVAPALEDTKAKLSPAEVEMSPEKHTRFVNAANTMATLIEKGTGIMQQVWSSALAAQEDHEPE